MKPHYNNYVCIITGQKVFGTVQHRTGRMMNRVEFQRFLSEV